MQISYNQIVASEATQAKTFWSHEIIHSEESSTESDIDTDNLVLNGSIQNDNDLNKSFITRKTKVTDKHTSNVDVIKKEWKSWKMNMSLPTKSVDIKNSVRMTHLKRAYHFSRSSVSRVLNRGFVPTPQLTTSFMHQRNGENRVIYTTSSSWANSIYVC